MSSLLLPLLVLLVLPPLASSHLLHSLSDDPHAFPKYRVTFLNGLPLLNETAERWLREGLRGGEAEFLDHPTPWQEPSPLKHIDAGDGTAVCSLYHVTSCNLTRPYTQAAVESVPDHAIELMKMGPRDVYLCFIPPPIEQEPPPPEETITEVTASHSWSLLQPLDGSCLYVCDVSCLVRVVSPSTAISASPRMVHLRILPQLPCPSIPRNDSPPVDDSR
jgi:protein OS-9